jgi:hypothetical protein
MAVMAVAIMAVAVVAIAVVAVMSVYAVYPLLILHFTPPYPNEPPCSRASL